MSLLRNTIGTALSGAAKVLGVGSKLLETTAKSLRPRTAPDIPARQQDTPAVDRPTVIRLDDDRRGRIVEPDPTPLLDEQPHLRTSESHISELASKSAGEVIAAVGGLSTDELRLLIEYEQSHRNRRTVMAAIEKAVAPVG